MCCVAWADRPRPQPRVNTSPFGRHAPYSIHKNKIFHHACVHVNKLNPRTSALIVPSSVNSPPHFNISWTAVAVSMVWPSSVWLVCHSRGFICSFRLTPEMGLLVNIYTSNEELVWIQGLKVAISHSAMHYLLDDGHMFKKLFVFICRLITGKNVKRYPNHLLEFALLFQFQFVSTQSEHVIKHTYCGSACIEHHLETIWKEAGKRNLGDFEYFLKMARNRESVRVIFIFCLGVRSPIYRAA